MKGTHKHTKAQLIRIDNRRSLPQSEDSVQYLFIDVTVDNQILDKKTLKAYEMKSGNSYRKNDEISG